MKIFKRFISAILLGAAAFSLTGCLQMEFYADADKYVAGSQYYDGELKTLDIDWTSGSVTLIQDETSDQIIVKEDNDLDDDKKVHSYFHDGILSIKYCKSGIRFGNAKSEQKQLFVTFPQLENLDLGITSGSANVEKLDAKTTKIHITSGSMNLGEINTDSFVGKITSGEINIALLNAEKADFDSTSGKLTIDAMSVEEADFDSTSGPIKANIEKADKLSFDITSGNLDLTIPAAGATVKLSQTSGKFNSTREHTSENKTHVYGDGSCKITINVTSGNVTIR